MYIAQYSDFCRFRMQRLVSKSITFFAKGLMKSRKFVFSAGMCTGRVYLLDPIFSSEQQREKAQSQITYTVFSYLWGFIRYECIF